MRLLFFYFLFMQHSLPAQNVGIGTNTPVEKLDVNGNVNIAGTIKANGVDGQPGQFITKTGSGIGWRTLSAADDTLAVYTATTSGEVQIFDVPAGVTKITVEAWGGGGAGGTASPGFTGGCAGGGGGGYIKSFFTVVPHSSVSITVGLGANAVAAAGSSSVAVNGTTVTALPGTSSRYSTGLFMDTFFIGRGGTYTISNANFKNYIFEKGADAEPVILKSFPFISPIDSSVDYASDFTWGKGGNAGNTSSTGGTGGQSASGAFIIAGGFLYHFSQGSPGGLPGGGGDRNRINNGGDGLVIIHY